MILLGASVSPFVRKVLVVAAEKGVKLENRPINPSTSTDPLFLANSPFRKVPLLVDADFTLADSTAIVTYLEALHPQPAADPKIRRVSFEKNSYAPRFKRHCRASSKLFSAAASWRAGPSIFRSS